MSIDVCLTHSVLTCALRTRRTSMTRIGHCSVVSAIDKASPTSSWRNDGGWSLVVVHQRRREGCELTRCDDVAELVHVLGGEEESKEPSMHVCDTVPRWVCLTV